MTKAGWAWVLLAFLTVNVVMAFKVSAWAGFFDLATLLAMACFYKDEED